MAGESLRTVDQMLAAWVDNTQGLITPLDGRDMIVSEAVNVGYLELDPGPATVPIVINTYEQVNQWITPSVFTANFWKLDGNNAFLHSYVDQGIAVPAGLIRLTTFHVGMVASKVGGGTATYAWSLFVDGVKHGTSGHIVQLTTTPRYVEMGASLLPDYSLSETFDVRVESIDSSDDVVLEEFRFTVQGVPV